MGVKESSADFGKVARLAASLPDRFLLFAGNDATALAVLALGGQGLISDAANVIPAEMAALVRAALGGDWEKARRLQKKYLALMEMNALGGEPGTHQVRARPDEALRRDRAPSGRSGRRRDAAAHRGGAGGLEASSAQGRRFAPLAVARDSSRRERSHLLSKRVTNMSTHRE